MAINPLTSPGAMILNQSVQMLKNQMTVLQSQLTTGNKSTTYAGMGVNEGFAIAARSQLSNMSAFSDTMSIVNSNIGVANTVLQALNDIGKTIQNSANSSSQTLNTSGQSIAQQTATSQLASMLGILNTQAGDRYLFSGTAVTTPAVASMDDIMNGTTTQAGLEAGDRRAQAGRCRHQRSWPSRHHVADRNVGEGGGRCRRFAVRPQARRGVVVADRCNGDRSVGIADRVFRSTSAPPTRTTATRSASSSICPTDRRNRFS